MGWSGLVMVRMVGVVRVVRMLGLVQVVMMVGVGSGWSGW